MSGGGGLDGGLSDGDGVSIYKQLLPSNRDRIRIRLANRYFMVTFFMLILL